jgi:ATP-dependent helicase/nuclease subunit B
MKQPSPITESIDTLAEAACKGLERLIEKFADPATPYQAVPKPDYRPRYDDYAHLARLAEWGRTGEE